MRYLLIKNKNMVEQEGPSLKEMGIETKINAKDTFIDALNAELDAMQQAGRISPERAEDKKKSASLIETGFSNNPERDALLFSRAGIAGEDELVDILENLNEEDATKEGISLDSISDFVSITENAKIEFSKRMQKDIEESEKKELVQAINTSDKVAKYFRSLVRRMGSDQSISQIEQVIAHDQERLKREIKNTGKTLLDTERGLERESILRLAMLAVQTIKDKR